MIEIVGAELYRWDTGRIVQITEVEADKVHFANKGDSKAVIMDIADMKSKIPDFLLQTGKQLCVYAVKNGITIESKIFYVKHRERPENYVYEEDQRNYIFELITNAEQVIKDAVKTVNGVPPDENGNVYVGSIEDTHTRDMNNPHGVTLAQIGAAPASHVTDMNNPHGVTPSQIGALPVSSGLLNSDTNFDAIQSNMIAWVNPWVGNNTGVHVPPKAGFIHSFEYSGQEVQRFYDTNGILLYRIKGGEWEYENPPMQLGQEYRTTERFNGRPVYVMAFYYGSLPASTGKDVAHGIANIRHAISVYITDSDIPSSWTGHHMVATCIFGATNVYVKTTDDISSRTVIANLKYTKTTD